MTDHWPLVQGTPPPRSHPSLMQGIPPLKLSHPTRARNTSPTLSTPTCARNTSPTLSSLTRARNTSAHSLTAQVGSRPALPPPSTSKKGPPVHRKLSGSQTPSLRTGWTLHGQATCVPRRLPPPQVNIRSCSKLCRQLTGLPVSLWILGG